MLQGLIRDLNESTRFFALTLADPFQGREQALGEVGKGGLAGEMALGEGAQVPERDGEATGIRRVGDVADRAVLRTAQREQGTLRARRASAARGRGSDLGDSLGR
jgi:hypothetical protein